MSFLGIRSLHASCSRSIINHVLVQVQPPRQHSLPLVSKTILSRHFTGTGLHSQRQVLGRITPKRIAIPFTPGSTSGNSDIPHASIWRPILFCLALGGGGYVFAAQYTNVDTAKWSEKLGSGKWWRKGQAQPSDREILRAKTLEGVKSAQTTLNNLPSTLSFLPKPLLVPIVRLYVLATEYTLNTPPAQLAPMAIISVMGVVFLGWRVRRLEPWMRKWWLHRPVVLSTRPIKQWAETVTLFTSTLSHQSLAHFAFNSFALFSFGAAAFSFISSPAPGTSPLPSSTHTPHFLAFLLVAGLTSSLSSHLWTNLVRLPRLVKSLSNPARLSSAQALAAHQAILPSLGASGAIYAALTLTACAYPDSNVGIIFIPFVSFPIGLGVAGMVTLDLIGLIRGWRMFDHVAHLSGAFFGVVYYQYGRQIWTWFRRRLGARERDSGFV